MKAQFIASEKTTTEPIGKACLLSMSNTKAIAVGNEDRKATNASDLESYFESLQRLFL